MRFFRNRFAHDRKWLTVIRNLDAAAALLLDDHVHRTAAAFGRVRTARYI